MKKINNYSVDNRQIGRLDNLIIILDENNQIYVVEDEHNVIEKDEVFNLNECTPISLLDKELQNKIKTFVGDVYE